MRGPHKIRTELPKFGLQHHAHLFLGLSTWTTAEAYRLLT